jgi:hypothetical protein
MQVSFLVFIYIGCIYFYFVTGKVAYLKNNPFLKGISQHYEFTYQGIFYISICIYLIASIIRIKGHYEIYKKKCEANNIQVNSRAMPKDIREKKQDGLK